MNEVEMSIKDGIKVPLPRESSLRPNSVSTVLKFYLGGKICSSGISPTLKTEAVQKEKNVSG